MRILIDGKGVVYVIGRPSNSDQSSPSRRSWEIPLGIRRREVRFSWFDPYLKDVSIVSLRWVELGMTDTTSGRHDLNLPRTDYFGVPKAILVLEFALYDDCDYLHVSVAVHTKTSAFSDNVIVNDPE